MTETFRAAGGLPLEDFFEHRPIEDENLVPAVDPRRDNTETQMRTALRALRTPKDGFVYEGVVINVYPSNTAAFVKRGQALNMKATTRNLMNPQSNFKLPVDTEPSINVYKVFMRGDAKPFPCGPNDPILYTYPEILAHESLRDKEPFSVGTIVELDDKKQSTIVNFYPGAVPIQWKDKSGTRVLFKNKTPVASTEQTDSRGRLVPATADGCGDSRTEMNPPRGILDEPIITSTIVPQYGGDPARKVGFIKGKESFIQKVEAAYQSLQAQGIDLIIGDSYRSYSSQKSAYMEKGQPGQEKAGDIAHPCKGYHVHAQAIDLEQGATQKADLLAHGPIYQALYAAGLRRIGNEFWHWSVGETDHNRNKVFARNRSGTSPQDTFTG